MIFNSSVTSNIYGDDCVCVFAEHYHQNNTMSNNVEYTYFGTHFRNNQSHTSALAGTPDIKYIIPDYYILGCFLPRTNEKIYFQHTEYNKLKNKCFDNACRRNVFFFI